MRHSPDEQGVSVTDLISAFLTGATAEFASLVRDPADSWKVRVEQATPKGLVDVAPERVVGFFFASASFANARVAGRIIFGDREYLVDTVVGPAPVAAQYNLQEWANALGRPSLVPSGSAGVRTIPHMERIVAGMAAALRSLEHEIATASPSVIARIEQTRKANHDRFQQSLLEDDHRRASAAAAEAFHAGDYQRVVKLLQSVEGLLSQAERKKLAYARRRLG